MIARLAGTLVQRDLDEVVVDCGGVGYAVACSLTTLAQLPHEGSPVVLITYTHVAEDALRLYGFATAEEKATFVALLATAGVGPKLALTILSTLTPPELRAAVAGRDKAAFTRIPGVGGKKAERLILELQDRLSGPTAPRQDAARQAQTDDLRSALLNLGFAQQAADKAASDVLAQAQPGAELATLVRHALQQLTKRS